MIMIVAGVAFLGSYLARQWLARTYAKWRQVPNASNANGAQVAQHILAANGLSHVKLQVSEGALTDHYIPSEDLLRLSRPVYAEPTVASMAIAAHECGHALQDAKSYYPLKLKAAMVPMASFASRIGMILLLGGGFTGSTQLVNIGGLMFLGAMGLQLLTLPIEIDASRRALNQITKLRLVDEKDRAGTKSMLTAAAMTYVAAAATSVAIVLFFLLQLLRNRR